MDRKSMKLLVAGLTALCGCAGMSREARQASVERLDEHGVSAPLLEVDPGAGQRGDDAPTGAERPHHADAVHEAGHGGHQYRQDHDR